MLDSLYCRAQGGITCEAIDEPRKSSYAIDERVIIVFSRQKCRNCTFSRQKWVFYPIYIYIYVLSIAFLFFR